MKNKSTFQKYYTSLIYTLVAIIFSATNFGAYWFINADTTANPGGGIITHAYDYDGVGGYVATNTVSILKVVDNDKPKIGTNVNYTITVKNNNSEEGDNITDIKISDILPNGVDFISANPGMGTYTDPYWNIPELDSGISAILLIEAHVSDSVTPNQAIPNTASIISLDQNDSNLDDNTATATITPWTDAPPAQAQTLTPPETPVPTATPPEPIVQVTDTKTGPNTYIIYAISALLSILAIGGLYLFKKERIDIILKKRS